ncbi:MAG: HD-GYP domain-containing protein, partial [Planctomycetota bacterium]
VGVSRQDEPVPDPVAEAETPRHLEHVDKADEILRLHDFIPETALQVVRQHHERYDGSGYPEGLSRSEIHPLARIAGLIDVFDLLTTGDESREALSSYDALHTIKTEFHRFDPQVFGNLIQMLACSSRLAG